MTTEWKKVKNCRSLLPALNKGVSFVKSAASGSVQPLGLSTSASSLNTGAGSNSSNNHGVSYPSSNNTIAPSSARISPAPFKQQEPLPSSQLNSSSSNNSNNISNKPKKSSSDTSNPKYKTITHSLSAYKMKKMGSRRNEAKKTRKRDETLPSFLANVTERDGLPYHFKNPSVLIEGVLFRARYLGSTQLVCEGQPTKATRMLQAEEAVSRIKPFQSPPNQPKHKL
ncbi:Protein lin-10 [Orchesella cincta]|uniref:Protein lin-10 n=1 Tax=Orchesella cincta TaxID=48709 RepID=A0A1D2NEP2_ORCCI|nr:Protein lin-10 [Orchesella cincta]